MTEELIINKFLERNYEVTVEKDDFCYLDIASGKRLDSIAFFNEFNLIIGVHFINDCTSYDVANKWVSEKTHGVMNKINEALSTLRVKLGPTEWVVYDKFGLPINEFNLPEALGLNYSHTFLDRFYSNWFSNETLRVSEGIMRFN